MASILDDLAPGSRVTLIRLRSLGDCVLTTPAIRILKAFRPDLRLEIVVESRFAAVFAGNSDIDKIVPPSILAARGCDLCLNLHGGSRSMWMTAMSGARVRAGFGHHAGAWTYSARIPRAQQILSEERTVHTAEHLASAMFYLGAPVCEIPRALLYASRWPEAPQRYAVVHPFASAPEKQWPAERFIEVMRTLDSEPVVSGAPGDDFSAFAGFRRVAGPLEQTKQVLAGASLFIGNDSGPAHMAAAFGVPVVVLYGSSDPVVWAPWRTRSAVFTGLRQTSPEQVIGAVERLTRGVSA
jgi:heptosyltransferase-3